MIKKILCLLFITSISISTIGCQLAKDEDSYKEPENIVGAFVTYNLDGDDKEYEIDELDKKHYGEIVADGDCKYVKFKNLEGQSIILQQQEKDGESYNEMLSSRAFQNQHLNVHINDENDYSQMTFEDLNKYDNKEDSKNQITENKVSATLYVTRKFKGIVDINPIIKEDDRYYTQRQFISYYIEGDKGGATSSSRSSSSTSGITNKETEIFTYDIKIEPIDEVKSVKVKEMSDDDKVISTKDITHTSDIYKYKIGKKTKYVIVEETCINAKGKEIKKRTIYGKDSIENESAIHMCAYANEECVVVPKYLEITL